MDIFSFFPTVLALGSVGAALIAAWVFYGDYRDSFYYDEPARAKIIFAYVAAAILLQVLNYALPR